MLAYARRAAGRTSAHAKGKKLIKRVNSDVERFFSVKAADKGSLKQEIASSYDPNLVEDYWYDWWEKNGLFSPSSVENDLNAQDVNSQNTFSMILPPPNVTGSLHIGHALTCTVQDVMARYNRMNGKSTVWIPGLDHAGIATQSVVERRLAKETGKTRHDIGRENLVEKIWEWKENHGGQITRQLRRLGASLDWSREIFTLDEHASEAVTEAFVRLYDDGLIYRSSRLVNWSSRLNTALSDIETSPLDLDGQTELSIPGLTKKIKFGKLERFAYSLESTEGSLKTSNSELVVATTRPETIFGDTAVAVHPDDIRYKHFHGKHVIQPLTGRRVPVVLDPVLVDPDKGTGAVKITPGHDFNDFECGKRHNLDALDIMRDDGTLNHLAPGFEGMNRLEARQVVLDALEVTGAYRGGEDMAMRVITCSRSGDVIEPRLKKMWFVNTEKMAKNALNMVHDGNIEIIPGTHKKIWESWLKEPRDWCISRQLWWGHRIPAFAVSSKSENSKLNRNLGEFQENVTWIAGRTEDEARIRAADILSIDIDDVELVQDPDVLDTWFSSGLFPLVCLQWPKQNPLESCYYPFSVLETGSDILFFWVARMVMLCSHLTGYKKNNASTREIPPFRNVYLHPMVRDANGRKMSKSLGNVIDPIDLIQGKELETLLSDVKLGNVDRHEVQLACDSIKKDFPKGIPECGTDGLRFALCAYMSQGDKINLDITRVQNYRFLCNKLWQAIKFVLRAVEGDGLSKEDSLINRRQLSSLLQNKESHHSHMAEHWILSRLDHGVEKVRESLDQYNFGNAANAIQNLLVAEFCDIYIEFAKHSLRSDVPEVRQTSVRTLCICAETILRLAHPIMPFVTEELWQRVMSHMTSTERLNTLSIMVAPFPTSEKDNTSEIKENPAELAMSEALDLLRVLRSGREEFRAYLSSDKPAIVYCGDDSNSNRWERIQGFLPDVAAQVRGLEATLLPLGSSMPEGLLIRNAEKGIKVGFAIQYADTVSKDIKMAKKRLAKVSRSVESNLKSMKKPGYEDKVPEEVRMRNRKSLDRLLEQKTTIEGLIRELELIRSSKC